MGKRREEASGQCELTGQEGGGRRPEGDTARQDTAAGQEMGGMAPRPARDGETLGTVGSWGTSDTLTLEPRWQHGHQEPDTGKGVEAQGSGRPAGDRGSPAKRLTRHAQPDQSGS